MQRVRLSDSEAEARLVEMEADQPLGKKDDSAQAPESEDGAPGPPQERKIKSYNYSKSSIGPLFPGL